MTPGQRPLKLLKESADPTRVKSPFASRWSRTLAYITDSWLLLAAQATGGLLGSQLAVMLSSHTGPVPADVPEAGFLVGALFWGFAAGFLNFGILQGTVGASVGKLVFSIRVVRADGAPIGIGRSLARSACTFLSILPCYLGYVWAYFSPRRQAWHDLICRTVVIRKGARFPVPLRSRGQEAELTVQAA